MEPSPPPFIIFRNPKIERVDIYQLALDFTAAIGELIAKVDLRFHVKDRMDRNALQIATWVGQAAHDPVPSARRKAYRHARIALQDCSTILDILARRSDVERELLDPAQKLVVQLISNVEQLANQ